MEIRQISLLLGYAISLPNFWIAFFRQKKYFAFIALPNFQKWLIFYFYSRTTLNNQF